MERIQDWNVQIAKNIHFVQVGYDRWPSVCMAATVTGLVTVGFYIDLVAFVREGGLFYNFKVPYDEDLGGYTWHHIDDIKHLGG